VLPLKKLKLGHAFENPIDTGPLKLSGGNSKVVLSVLIVLPVV